MHQPISSLNLPEYKIQELKLQGFSHCKDVEGDETAKAKIGLSEWLKLRHIPKTRSALEILHNQCLSGSIVTSSKELDEALGSGVPIGLITEFCGESGCGKTQLCFYLCVNVQLPKWCGGLAGESVYVSTYKSFAAHRLKEIAEICVRNYEKFKLKCSVERENDENFNVASILKKVRCIELKDYVEMMALVQYIKDWLNEHSLIRLVVIDSISVPFKVVAYRERTQYIYSFLNDLQCLAKEHRFAIVLTNDMTTRIDSSREWYNTPSLGGSYYHRINTRVHLHKLSQDTFEAKVVKSCLQSSCTVQFKLFS